MNEEGMATVASLALAMQAVLTKTLVELRQSGALSSEQISRACNSAIRVLEEGEDPTFIQASLFVENLRDELVPPVG